MASAVTAGPAAEIGSAATLVIQQKLEVPPLSETRVARPRVESRLAELIDTHRVVAVLATAGAGKTTAVAAAAELLGRRIAWLTLDTPDVAQGRLLTYLEASLARVAPQVSGVVAPGAVRRPRARRGRRACWRTRSATSGSSSCSTTWSASARRVSRGS